jgi:hypothetical protein
MEQAALQSFIVCLQSGHKAFTDGGHDGDIKRKGTKTMTKQEHSAIILEDMKRQVKKLMAYRYQHGYDRQDFEQKWQDVTDQFNKLNESDKELFNEYCD